MNRGFYSVQLILQNIRQLVTVAARGAFAKSGHAMRDLGVLDDATVLIEDGIIRWVGASSDFHEPSIADATMLDCSELAALPGFVDSHTHLLFAGSREDEFAMRVEGRSYQEIADAGGGILSTVNATRAASKKELKKLGRQRLDDMLKLGTTTVEIKSGYGLTQDDEIKMLEAINELAEEHYSTVVATFLGAHALPPEFAGNADGYVAVLCQRLLPYIAKRKLAAFCDAFCETKYFTVAQTETLFRAALAAGLKLKRHADQLTQIGASKLGASFHATSIDHLEKIDSDAMEAIREAGSIATVLPGVSFFLNYGYPPARQMIDSGLPIAIATNFNPGSCMSFSMPMMMTIACTHMGLTPEEALAAATVNGAAALNLSHRIGSIEVGKEADIILYRIPHYRHLAYHFGVNHVETIIKRGVILEF
ncbi:MAG: imidazolonepropionase [Ignavibacteriales bacterium]|nr:imidazolonepropionase [Ignavibacteriales bacterium]